MEQKKHIFMTAGITIVILILGIVLVTIYVKQQDGDKGEVKDLAESGTQQNAEYIEGTGQQIVSPALTMVTPQPIDLNASQINVGNAPIYPMLDEDILENKLHRSEWVDVMIREDDNLPLHGSSVYTISMVPILLYNVEADQYATSCNYLLCEDITNLKDIGTLQVTQAADGSYQTAGITTDSVPERFADLMAANPERKYIFLYNGTILCMLDEDNNLYASPYSDEIQVIGDYYHALDYTHIAVSYLELTDSAHLLHYQDYDSDGKYEIIH